MKWKNKIKTVVLNDKDMNNEMQKMKLQPSREATCCELVVTRDPALTIPLLRRELSDGIPKGQDGKSCTGVSRTCS